MPRCRPQLCKRMPYDLRRPLQAKGRHDSSNNHIRPACTSAKDAERAANRTARLPITSLREHSQAERILLSPARKTHSKPNTAPLSTSAANPISPIVTACGRLHATHAR